MFPQRALVVFSMISVCWLIGTQAGAQQQPVSIPAGGVSLLAKDAADQLRVNARPELASKTLVRISDRPFRSALCVNVLKVPDRSWDVQAVTNIQGAIERGDVLLLSCWLRCLETTSEDGQGRLRVHVQRNRAPHDKLLTLPVSVGLQWRQVVHPFRAAFDLPDGNSNIAFHLGLRQQRLLIADVRLVNYGSSKTVHELPTFVETYRGRSLDAAWRTDADQRIKKLRQARLRVAVQDAAGKPVPNASVEVTMLRHEFTFGSAVAAKLLAADTEDARKYRAVVREHYNKVVFENDLKWEPWDNAKSNKHRSFRREWTDRAFNWLRENRIAVRGHYITWAPLKPHQLARYRGNGDRLRADLWDHMQDKLPDVGDQVTDWDVINHIVGWGETIESVVGTRDIYCDIVKRSRELVPKHVQLWINEGQVLPSGQRTEPYEVVTRYLIDHGATPDGIGFMGHFGAHAPTPPERLYEIFDRFARLSDNLQITELDVNVGQDEQLQADYLRDVMTIAFSHPNMRSIIMWGFWEGRHWKPDAALYRRDWSIKPAGVVWRKLVLETWWTDVTGTTDAGGTFATDGFLGEYQVKVTSEKKVSRADTKLTKPGQTLTVVLK